MAFVVGEKVNSVTANTGVKLKDKIWVPFTNFSISYFVVGDTTATTHDTIVNVSGVPQLFSSLNGAYCTERNPKEIDIVINPLTSIRTGLWEVECKFTTDFDPEQSQPPESQTPILRWYGEQEEEVMEKDADNEPVATANNEPILLTKQTVLPVLEITRFEFAPFDPQTILLYANHINSAVFYGAPIGTALMMPPEAEEEVRNNTKYVRVTYRIKFKLKEDPDNPETFLSNTWDIEVLHQGTLVSKTGITPPVVATDPFGNPRIVNLDNTGRELPASSDPEFLTFKQFATRDFNNLNLGPF